MSISIDRIQADIAAIAACTETPGAGVTRATFSSEWRQARDYVSAQLESIGCRVRVDAIGNLHARPSAIAWESPAWMSGSHLDSVPRGGNYDGVLGVTVAMEALRAAREDIKVALPLELVVWAESSNAAQFGVPMVGSRAYVGEIDAQALAALKSTAGIGYAEMGAPHGVRVADLGKPAERLQRSAAIGFIEVHIDQGPELWNEDCPVAVATAVSGHRTYHCTIAGTAQHAGSTPMNHRHDALACAAEVILAFEKLSRDLGHRNVITVGEIVAQPNIVGVINGRADLMVDLRGPATDVLARADSAIRHAVGQIVHHRGLTHELVVTESRPALEFSSDICTKIARVSASHCKGNPVPRTSAGEPHDAAILSPHVPSAMLFVASRDGITHHPDEFCRPADLALAARILLDTVKDRRLE